MAAADLIPVVQRSYDLCTAVYEHVNRFTRIQRGLLGKVIIEDALQLLVGLTVANRQADKVERLSEASGRLDALRITLRLSKRLGFLSNGGYQQVTETADEVGRMLGGWLKYETDSSRKSETVPAAISPAERKRTGGVRYTMTSPTIERYLRAKLEHPGEIVLVTVGAFCQTFFEDAVTCGQLLRFAVRNLAADSEPEKILACGFPRVRLKRYLELLRRAGRPAHVE